MPTTIRAEEEEETVPSCSPPFARYLACYVIEKPLSPPCPRPPPTSRASGKVQITRVRARAYETTPAIDLTIRLLVAGASGSKCFDRTTPFISIVERSRKNVNSDSLEGNVERTLPEFFHHFARIFSRFFHNIFKIFPQFLGISPESSQDFLRILSGVSQNVISSF